MAKLVTLIAVHTGRPKKVSSRSVKALLRTGIYRRPDPPKELPTAPPARPTRTRTKVLAAEGEPSSKSTGRYRRRDLRAEE